MWEWCWDWNYWTSVAPECSTTVESHSVALPGQLVDFPGKLPHLPPLKRRNATLLWWRGLHIPVFLGAQQSRALRHWQGQPGQTGPRWGTRISETQKDQMTNIDIGLRFPLRLFRSNEHTGQKRNQQQRRPFIYLYRKSNPGAFDVGFRLHLCTCPTDYFSNNAFFCCKWYDLLWSRCRGTRWQVRDGCPFVIYPAWPKHCSRSNYAIHYCLSIDTQFF